MMNDTEKLDKLLDVLNASFIKINKEDIMVDTILVSNFFDCDCHEDHIKRKSKTKDFVGYCNTCNQIEHNCPDSRLNELLNDAMNALTKKKKW